MNKWLLHGEGLIVFALCIYFYASIEMGWILFALLLFAPDLSMFGYLVNRRIGAKFYNLFHTYIVSVGVTVFGYLFYMPIMFAVGLIWTAHIGLDRLFGYGLKYPTEFKDTHLQRV